eukprot:CAMPEP_0168616596 /NCGR_PEP_ID=MMETSP0449_2-20121227/5107_1 /TAXON_ID=1082188 /ORGANISM="Strombidium rassoulzadegani, Strain ras09" /LENGTH=180 /DNA_ID=CAMNT_0008657383 /DNA_START=20 /DNA_END=562 /DNA_ORIENTATION=+
MAKCEDSESEEERSLGEWQPNGRFKYEMRHVDSAIQIALNKQKHSLIFEPNGDVDLFFKVKAKLTEFHRTFIGIKIGQITKREGLDTMRAQLVQAMKAGERMCIMIGKIAPDFKEQFNDPLVFPTDTIFDFENFRKIENYKKVVREDEDYDYQNNKGCFMMHEDYNLVLLSNAQNEEEKQ